MDMRRAAGILTGNNCLQLIVPLLIGEQMAAQPIACIIDAPDSLPEIE
jgi:hypothetical protein